MSIQGQTRPKWAACVASDLLQSTDNPGVAGPDRFAPFPDLSPSKPNPSTIECWVSRGSAKKNRRQPANRSEVHSDEEVVPGTQSNGQRRGQKPFRAQNPLKTVDGHRTPDVHDDPCCGCWCRCASARQRALRTISEISMRELILTPANWRGGLRMKTHARFNATRTSQSCSATHSRALTSREHVVRERNLFRRDGDAI